MTAYLRLSDERGSVSVEFAVVATVFVVGFLSLVVFAGRVGQASNEVISASQEAARAASLTGDPGAAIAAGRATAIANLRDAGVACSGGGPTVDVNVANFVPGGTVTVTVVCFTDNSDMGALGVPGSRKNEGVAIEVIDALRSE